MPATNPCATALVRVCRLGAVLAQRGHRYHGRVGQRFFDRCRQPAARPDFEETASRRPSARSARCRRTAPLRGRAASSTPPMRSRLLPAARSRSTRSGSWACRWRARLRPFRIRRSSGPSTGSGTRARRPVGGRGGRRRGVGPRSRSPRPPAPEITTEAGPLTAAMPTSGPSSGRTSSSVACTAIIAPPAGSACMNRPRAATSTAAFSSDSTPATCAADSSPIEWPITKSGRTPQDSSSRNNATSTANSAGCANSVVFKQVFVVAPDDFAQWPQQVPIQFGHDGVERLGEHRVCGVQSHSHAQRLGALAGEDEDGLAAGRCGATNDRAGSGHPRPAHPARPATGRDHRRRRRPDARRSTGPPTTTPHRQCRVHRGLAHAPPTARPEISTPTPTSPTPPTAPRAVWDRPRRARARRAAQPGLPRRSHARWCR